MAKVWKVWKNLSLYANDIIMCEENPKESIHISRTNKWIS